jgi:hypothetical protein
VSGIVEDMNQNDLHPTDDQPEPGAFSTLGYLHHELENYVTKRDAVRAAEDAVKFAEQVLTGARLELTWAKRNLTEAIEKAQLVTTADALNKGRLTEAPSIEIPLPPGTQFKAPDPFETPKPTQDFDANDTAYDAPKKVWTENPEIGDYPYAAEKKPDSDPFGGDRPF